MAKPCADRLTPRRRNGLSDQGTARPRHVLRRDRALQRQARPAARDRDVRVRQHAVPDLPALPLRDRDGHPPVDGRGLRRADRRRDLRVPGRSAVGKDRPINYGSSFSFGLFAWGLFFTATGATSLIASLTNQAIQDSSGGKLGGLIVGGTFLLMGAPALLLSLWRLVSGLGKRDERPVTATAGAGMGGLGGGM